MATSKCPSCNNHSFEMKEISPRGSQFKYNFIQCSACGAVVGVVDYFNTARLLHNLAEQLNVEL